MLKSPRYPMKIGACAARTLRKSVLVGYRPDTSSGGGGGGGGGGAVT